MPDTYKTLNTAPLVNWTRFYKVHYTLGWLTQKIEGKKPLLFLPQLPKQEQVPERFYGLSSLCL